MNQTPADLVGFSTTRTPRAKDHASYLKHKYGTTKDALAAFTTNHPRRKKVCPVYIETAGDYRMFTEPAISLAKAQELVD